MLKNADWVQLLGALISLSIRGRKEEETEVERRKKRKVWPAIGLGAILIVIALSALPGLSRRMGETFWGSFLPFRKRLRTWLRGFRPGAGGIS